MLFRGVVLGPTEPPQDVRIVGERVVEVGALRAESGELVREGGALLPGWVDGHVHLASWAASLDRLDVSGARSAHKAAELVRDHPDALSGFGFRDALWPDRPHKDLLEQVMPGRPVALLSADVHTLWLSPAMLHELGVDHETGVVRDEAGLALMAEIDRRRPLAESDEAVQRATRLLAERGVTGVLDFEYADGRADWLRRLDSAPPSVRVCVAAWSPWLEQATERTGEQIRGLLFQGPLKVMVDGSLNTRTAACHDPYPDPSDGTGRLFFEVGELAELMQRAWDKNISTAAHAIGDRAASVVLEAFERVGCAGRIEHAQQVRPQDLARMARPGLVVSVQPQHAMDDRDVADVHWPDRQSLAYAYGSLHRAGAQLQLGSDAPVAIPDPRSAMSDAVLRSDDGRPPWMPDEALPLDVALCAASGGRTRVEIGDVADLVHTEAQPLLVGAADLRHLPVLTTVLNGVITHRVD